MEKNFISQYQATCFYINIQAKQYGVCINIKDIDKADEIIEHFLTSRKENIEAWKQEWKEEENNNGITSINNSEKVVVENQQA